MYRYYTLFFDSEILQKLKLAMTTSSAHLTKNAV